MSKSPEPADTGANGTASPNPWDSMDPLTRVQFGLPPTPDGSPVTDPTTQTPSPTPNTNDALRLKPEVVIAAAGGYDAIAAELVGNQITVLREGTDSGNDELNAALGNFAQRWSYGLEALMASQVSRARNLRAISDYIVGLDTDRAYVLETYLNGVDFV